MLSSTSLAVVQDALASQFLAGDRPAVDHGDDLRNGLAAGDGGHDALAGRRDGGGRDDDGPGLGRGGAGHAEPGLRGGGRSAGRCRGRVLLPGRIGLHRLIPPIEFDEDTRGDYAQPPHDQIEAESAGVVLGSLRIASMLGHCGFSVNRCGISS